MNNDEFPNPANPEYSPDKNTPALTPMLQQYREIKSRHADSILFYRMGDFYEMFFEDALTAAPLLEVQLTSRDKSAANPIPMCGVPFHALAQYLPKLLSKGKKVALCEQVEDPALAKGIVKRDVVRVFTPSLIGDPDLVGELAQNYLVCLYSSSTHIEVACLELLGSQTQWGQFENAEDLVDWLDSTRPKELLIHSQEEKKTWFAFAKERRILPTLSQRDGFFNPTQPRPAWDALLAYLAETQKLNEITTLAEPTALVDASSLKLDTASAHSLEITQSYSGSDGPTLFNTLNKTQTAMGSRLFKDWLLRPSGVLKTIVGRHEVVEEFYRKPDVTQELRQLLSQVRDLERLATKTALGLALPRDLVAIRAIQKLVPTFKAQLEKLKAPLLKRISKNLNPLIELTSTLDRALLEEAPAQIREGGIFLEEYHPDLRELRSLSRDAKTWIAQLEVREKERTGISSLKIKFSKVFGYTLEITKGQLAKVPEDYIRKQTIANGERFITEELKSFEEKVLTAEARLRVLEENLFYELRSLVAEQAAYLLENARLIAQLDVLLSFAVVAREKNYVRPTMHAGWNLTLVDARHPVVEDLLPTGSFVPNSLQFLEGNLSTLLITGPNMGGKSTIMRQVALISCLAQAGSFVPARRAELPVLDAIFTRIGSSDDLARGRSTFMVEMSEVTRILLKATPRSLILIDEVGRGTSTYDGLSLAWALLEHLHLEVKAKTLFATHFHELTELAKHLPGLKNANVLVQKTAEGVLFLYELADGICSKSYGIEVAQLAGLPPKLLLRAREILGRLESQSHKASRTRNRALDLHQNQIPFLDAVISPENLTQSESQINQ